MLLIGIGSDLAMMEALNEYGRPFHQRATELVVPPLNPGEVATLLGLPPAEAFDAYLVSGGLPLILDDWPAGATVPEYLSEVVADPTSALLVSGERVVAAATPLSTRPARETRYAVADPYLRFWLAFLGPYAPEIERGRGDLTLARSGDPEIDLVGADRGPVARTISFVGSVKWQEQRPFDARDLGRLVAHRRQLLAAYPVA